MSRVPATIRRFSLSDEGFARTSVREKHAEPSDTVQDVTACTMQRQAKRLRAETGATDYSTIAPGYGQPRISAGTGSKLVNGKPAWKRPFLFGVQEPFLFSGKYRKEKWVLICAGYRLQTSKKTDCHGSVRTASQ